MISSASPLASSALRLPRWTLPRAPLLPTPTPSAPLTLRPRPRTKARTSACRWSVALEGACVCAVAHGAGQRGDDDDDDVESAAGKVGHEDHGPHRFDCRGRGNRHHHYRRCRSCRRRRFPLSGGGGGVRRGRCPSVVIGQNRCPPNWQLTMSSKSCSAKQHWHSSLATFCRPDFAGPPGPSPHG